MPETVSMTRPRSRRTCRELLVLAYPTSICTRPVLLITSRTLSVVIGVTEVNSALRRRCRRAHTGGSPSMTSKSAARPGASCPVVSASPRAAAALTVANSMMRSVGKPSHE